MTNWICHISALNVSFRMSADWDSMAISVPTFHISLPHHHPARGWITDTGGERCPNTWLRSYYRMYMEDDFLQTALSPSVNTSAGVCPIHPDNPVSICVALFELTPSLLFVLSLFAGMLADKGLFLFYAFKRHCSCSDVQG